MRNEQSFSPFTFETGLILLQEGAFKSCALAFVPLETELSLELGQGLALLRELRSIEKVVVVKWDYFSNCILSVHFIEVNALIHHQHDQFDSVVRFEHISLECLVYNVLLPNVIILLRYLVWKISIKPDYIGVAQSDP